MCSWEDVCFFTFPFHHFHYMQRAALKGTVRIKIFLSSFLKNSNIVQSLCRDPPFPTPVVYGKCLPSSRPAL